MNSAIEDSKHKLPTSDIDHIFEILEETLGGNIASFSSKLRN